MKAFVLLTLFIVMPSFTSAAPADGKASSNSKSIVNKPSSQPDYRILGNRICNAYVDSSNLKAVIPNLIFDFMRDNEPEFEDPEFELDLVAQKLIDNKHDLKCSDGKDIVAVSFAHGHEYTVMDDIFLGLVAGDEVNFDFNGATWTKNPATNDFEYMTSLDFIEKVELYKLERGVRLDPEGFKDEYNDLKKFTKKMRKFGAKNYTEFTAAERKQIGGN